MTDSRDARPFPGRAPATTASRRFYQRVAIAAAEDAQGFRVLLDGKPARTPRKAALALPTRALAEAIAQEWSRQGERIDPADMPMTRLANTVIDGIAGREADVVADIVKYAASDLVCYAAEGPAELIARQDVLWQPLREWAAEELGAQLASGAGIAPIRQPASAIDAIGRALAPLDPYRLAAVHVMTTLMGSAILALAVHRGRLSAVQAWSAAHVDEDWQIAKWGEDAEAARRRARRWDEMQAAARLLQLIAER